MPTQAWAWHPRLHAVMVLSFFLLLPGACNEPSSEDGGAADAEAAAKPVTKTADRGPVSLSVTADRDRISIAERLELRVEVKAADGIDVKMPEFGAEMNDFQIRDYRALSVETFEDGTRQYVQVYDLDIFLSGEYQVPAITAYYRDQRDEKEQADDSSESGDEQADEPPMAELTTEPFTITVESLLEGEFDPQQFRDVKAVATLEADRQWMWVAWASGAVGALVLAVVAVVLWRKRSAGGAKVVVIPPHEWAFQQLRDLADAKLVEEGRIKAFYYRLSEIARTYIELRFALMAPERTTEEFLEEMRSSDALPSGVRPSLAAFLEACDMVKYARYEPGTAEIEQVFNTARDFVEQTKPSATVSREAAA